MSNIATIAQPTQQVVDTRYTQDVIPVLDTSKFEHMQRIANVMANTASLPDSLRFGDPTKKTDPFSPDVILATCFRIVNQAVRWGLDPFAVSDCASIIKGRLCWEGKLVHGVIAAKTGINLSYDFFDADKARMMGVEVSGVLDGEREARTVRGRVCDWHTGEKGPWAREGNWERQLRYRGAREWARAHAPHILLGIYVDDELAEIAALDIPAGQRAQRMKDVTPKPEAPAIENDELPDIPDIPAEDESQDVPEDEGHEGFLAMLRHKMTEADPIEVWDELSDVIGELPSEVQRKAEAIYEELTGELV